MTSAMWCHHPRPMRALGRYLPALLVVTFLAIPTSIAQPVPPPSSVVPSADDAKEAKRHFTVGNDLYHDGRYQDALVEFDASYRLGGRPSALRNAADCRRQLNEYKEPARVPYAVGRLRLRHTWLLQAVRRGPFEDDGAGAPVGPARGENQRVPRAVGRLRFEHHGRR